MKNPSFYFKPLCILNMPRSHEMRFASRDHWQVVSRRPKVKEYGEIQSSVALNLIIVQDTRHFRRLLDLKRRYQQKFLPCFQDETAEYAPKESEPRQFGLQRRKCSSTKTSKAEYHCLHRRPGADKLTIQSRWAGWLAWPVFEGQTCIAAWWRWCSFWSWTKCLGRWSRSPWIMGAWSFFLSSGNAWIWPWYRGRGCSEGWCMTRWLVYSGLRCAINVSVICNLFGMRSICSTHNRSCTYYVQGSLSQVYACCT